MTIEAFRNGSRKFSHSMTIGGEELILYYEVEMSADSIKEFAELMNIKEKVEKFYACVVITERNTPRTFIAYERKDGTSREFFNVSTGISVVEILRNSFMKGACA